MGKFAYRGDIDGLRAVAVLAVVLFHLGIERLEGGFLGVDVFFVISGFLITSIIAPKIWAGEFSFKGFYLKRIRRLIPPALVTVVATFAASAVIMTPEDLMAMARTAIAAVFSVSNIVFFTEAGYWDTQSELKPLLHTWSLGVEEQFYLFWPLLVAGLCAVTRRTTLAYAFVAATVIGLGVSEAMLRASPSAAFFLLPARFFEFSLGALFAFVPATPLWSRLGGPVVRGVMSVIGLVVLLVCFWVYKGDTPFPGVNAVVPCVATGLLLLSGVGGQPWLGPVLSNPVSVWLGRVSYSLYLVHWPVVSLMRYRTDLHLSPGQQVTAAAMMAVLTVALYYGVEQRLSSRAGQGNAVAGTGEAPPRKRLANGAFALRTGVAAVAVSGVFAQASFGDGWAWRFPGIEISAERADAYREARYALRQGECQVEDYASGPDCIDDGRPRVLIIGDSHERDGINFLSGVFGGVAGIQILRFGQTNNCKKTRVPGKGPILDDPECEARVDTVASPEVISTIDLVVYSANRPYLFNESATLDVLRTFRAARQDLPIVGIGAYLVTGKDCLQMMNLEGGVEACRQPGNVVHTGRDDVDDPLWNAFGDVLNARVDLVGVLCPGDVPQSCEVETPDGHPMMLDTNHKTYEFAVYAGERFAAANPGFFSEFLDR